MRLSLLLATSIFLVLSNGYRSESHAQITVTEDKLLSTYDGISSGTQYIIQEDNHVSVLIGQSGPDQVWDFTGMSHDATMTGNYTTLDDPAAAPGGDHEHFENAQMVLDYELVSTTGFDEEEAPGFFKTYTYLDLQDGSGYSLGSVTLMEEGSEDMFIVYNRPPRLDYELPATYGDSWSYSFVQEQVTPDMTLEQSIDVVVEVDGWGELITPVGTFDVLRIKSEETQMLGGMEMTFTDYIFVDENGRQLASIDNPTDASYYEYTLVTSAGPDPDIADAFTLGQNYPNPFNPETTIAYQLQESGHVTLEVYSVSGRHITTLVDETQRAGEHTISFDASALSSGVYMYRLHSGDAVHTQMMTLVK